MAIRLNRSGPPASTTLHVVQVCSRQASDSGLLHFVGHLAPLPQTLGRIRHDEAHQRQAFQETIQARPTDLNYGLQAANSRGTEDGQLTQDICLRPTTHEVNRHLYIGWQLRSNQSRHASILQDSTRPQRPQTYLTLLLNNRIVIGLSLDSDSETVVES